MRSNYKRLGKYIHQVSLRNKNLTVKNLQGININKNFMPSVANTHGVDLSKYKIVSKRQFAFNPMHVGRDEVLPISMLESDGSIIVSPAYVVFEIKDVQELLPEYLMMWCRRSEFDRNAWFTTDSSVRGGFSWSDFCSMELPVPSIEKQREIVKEYNVISNRIKLNENLNHKLEETAQTIYKHWFVDFEFSISKEYAEEIGKPELEGKPYKSSGGEMIYCEEFDQKIPKGWKIASIGKYSKVKSGYAFKSEWWQSSGTPVIKIGSINNNTIEKNLLDFVSNEKVEKAKNYRVQEGDIVIAMTGATIGKIGLVPKLNDIILVNQRVGMFELGNNPKDKAAFLYFNLLNNFVQNEIKNIGGDSAQANISNGQIQEIEILYPAIKLIQNFNKIGKPIIVTILGKIAENQKLREWKDILLSKLATIES